MTNQEKFSESYSDLVDILYNFTGVLSSVKNTKDINDEDLKLLGELTTNLKRLGECNILEKRMVVSPTKNIEKEDRDVNK